MTLAEVLAQLARAIAANQDPGYAGTHAFHAGDAVTAAELDAREQQLGISYPPSYRAAVLAHGLFTLGAVDAMHDHLVFRLWPVGEHRTALAHYAEQLDCDATAGAVADAIGVDEAAVAALAQAVLIGVEGHEDYIGFDLRTRNAKTRECCFGLVLFDDTEIEAFANEAAAPCRGLGFDTWLAEHIERRA